MRGIDTNVLVRFLADVDSPEQTRHARAFIETACTIDDPGYVNAIVFVELAWVLKSTYGFTQEQVLLGLRGILEADNLLVEDELVAEAALTLAEMNRGGFADAYLGLRNQEAGCALTVTFDRRAARLPMFEPV